MCETPLVVLKPQLGNLLYRGGGKSISPSSLMFWLPIMNAYRLAIRVDARGGVSSQRMSSSRNAATGRSGSRADRSGERNRSRQIPCEALARLKRSHCAVKQHGSRTLGPQHNPPMPWIALPCPLAPFDDPPWLPHLGASAQVAVSTRSTEVTVSRGSGFAPRSALMAATSGAG